MIKDKLLVLLWQLVSNIRDFHDLPQNIFFRLSCAMCLHENIKLCGWFTHHLFLHKIQSIVDVVSVKKNKIIKFIIMILTKLLRFYGSAEQFLNSFSTYLSTNAVKRKKNIRILIQ